MKRFKKIAYILDEKSLTIGTNSDKVAMLARLNNARVIPLMYHEAGLYDIFSIKFSSRYEDLAQAIREQHQEQLVQYFNHKRWEGIDVESGFSFADGVVPLVQEVMKKNCDLAIKEEFNEQGIGQLAMRLVRKSPCPVWIMKQSTGEFRRVLAAIDVGTNRQETMALNQKIIQLAHSLAQRERGEAHYLNVWQLDYEAMLVGPRFKVPPEEVNEMKNELLLQRQQRLTTLLDTNHISHENNQIHILEGNFDKIVRKSIQSLNIDVVVMGSIGRSGIPGFLIGNSAEKLLTTINCTVLTVKPDGFISPITLD